MICENEKAMFIIQFVLKVFSDLVDDVTELKLLQIDSKTDDTK